MRKFQEYEIHTVADNEKFYPRSLCDIAKKISILYYKGDISIVQSTKNIAVIGTRKMSEQGGRLAYETGRAVAEKRLNLVNGLALGCDAAAVRGALSANGKCIAVMPCGLDQIQPKTHYRLAEEILEKGGCLISEYPTGTGVQRYQYVERDRIQSGISQGIIVIEAEDKSGTMHTVNFSLKQHKRLACYNYELVAHSSGNQFLERNSKIQILNSKEEGIQFIDLIAVEREYQQISLF